MFQKYSKKVVFIGLLIMMMSMFVSEVFATELIEDYTFYGDGMTIEVASKNKMKGTVTLKSVRGELTQYYKGQLRFDLYKKSALGSWSRYSDRIYKDTYGIITITAIWANCSSAYHKGTLQLYKPDESGQYSGLTTTFSISN